MAYSTDELLEEVLLKLQGNVRYTTALRLRGLNRGLIDLTRFIGENLKVYEVLNPKDPADNSRYAMEFPLPQDQLFVQSVSFNGFPLRRLSQPEFVSTGGEFDVVQESGAQVSNTFAASIAPTSFYIRANQFLNLWPRPTSQRKVQAYYIAMPAELFNPDPGAATYPEVPELNVAYSDSLIFYCLYWCLVGQTGEEGRASAFLQLYEKERARAKFDLSQNDEHKIVRMK